MREQAYRSLLFVSGWISLSLGVIGIVLPVLPTTVFVLMAGFCFARSSPRFHHWIMTHRLFGPMIKNFSGGRGIPRAVRFRAVVLIWVTMSLSMWLIREWWSVALLVPIGLAVSFYLYRLPTYEG